jgi:HEAT repeat protein
MTQRNWSTLIGVLVLLNILLTPIALAAGPAADPAPVTQWEYFWNTRADGLTEVWRHRKDGSTSTAQTWEAVAKIPAAVVQFAVAPAQSDVIYARTREAIFRSLDAGQRWVRLADLPDIPSTLAVGRQTADLLYLGTKTGGLYRSQDGGHTWQRASTDLGMLPGTILEVTALAVAPQDDRMVYAATGYWLGTTQMHFAPIGVFGSVDGGATWLPLHRAHPGEGAITALTAVADQPLAVQAATGKDTRWYAFRDTTFLAGWLTSEQIAQRAAAATALGLLGGDAARRSLAERLATESDLAAGQAIAHALGPLATPAMVLGLIDLLWNDDPNVRWRATVVLGYIPTPESVKALGETLLNDNSIARQAAAEGLGRIGTAAAAAEVIPLLDASELTTDRHLALSTLEQMGDVAVDPLVAALTADRPALRLGVAEALGWMRSPRATAALAEALNDPSDAVRAEVAWVLGEIGTVQAREALAIAVNDPSAQVRAQAVAILGATSAQKPMATAWPVAAGWSFGWLMWLPWAVIALMLTISGAIAFAGRGSRPRTSPRS